MSPYCTTAGNRWLLPEKSADKAEPAMGIRSIRNVGELSKFNQPSAVVNPQPYWTYNLRSLMSLPVFREILHEYLATCMQSYDMWHDRGNRARFQLQPCALKSNQAVPVSALTMLETIGTAHPVGAIAEIEGIAQSSRWRVARRGSAARPIDYSSCNMDQAQRGIGALGP
jgi:hypothetical protein